MTKDEELQALREENRLLKALVAELLPLKEHLAQATARITLADSSSLLPSADAGPVQVGRLNQTVTLDGSEAGACTAKPVSADA